MKKRKIKLLSIAEILLGAILIGCFIFFIVSSVSVKKFYQRFDNTFIKGVVLHESDDHIYEGFEQSLYGFQYHQFTSCGMSGHKYPKNRECFQAYQAMSWVQNKGFFSVFLGIQYWQVPRTGRYQIIARGAQGGCLNGGAGAVVADQMMLNKGDKIALLVGQQGECSVRDGELYYFGAGGGGGASFVMLQNEPLLIAAGGGGGGGDVTSQKLAGGSGIFRRDAQQRQVRKECRASSSGTNGQGGGAGVNYGGAGGGGFKSDGGNILYKTERPFGEGFSTKELAFLTKEKGINESAFGGVVCYGTGGQSYLDGGLGGKSLHCPEIKRIANGGFGGGGAGVHYSSAGGGGGGWSGGAGGYVPPLKFYDDCGPLVTKRALGGGSYMRGAQEQGLGYNYGDGSIFIRYVGTE